LKELESLIRDMPDFPKKGIIFKDITTLLRDKQGLKKSIDILVDKYKDEKIDYVVGAESRGFIFGTALAYAIGAGFVPVRKPGKLPGEVFSVEYDLEYGSNTLQIHCDAIEEGKNVLIIDDLLATGGTSKAVLELISKLKANTIGLAFLIELEFLKGRKLLEEYEVYSIIKY